MIELKPIGDLIPYANNARAHSVTQIAQLAGVIDHFGFAGVIVVRDGTIAKGHGTIKAVQQLLAAGKHIYPAPGRRSGAEPLQDGHLPVQDATGWSDSDFRAYCLADNQQALNAGWDEDLLKIEVGDLSKIDYNMDLIGFNADEVAGLLGGLDDGVEGNTDPDEIPEEPEEPVSKLGDIWILGDHRVMCGDSTSDKDVGLLMGGEKAELLFTSPPYSDMREYSGNDISIGMLIGFIGAFFEYCEYQVINLGLQRKNHEIVEYWQDYITKAKECGYKFLSWNVWDKIQSGSIASATAMFVQSHEWLFVFGKEFKRLNRTIPNQLDKYEARHGPLWKDRKMSSHREADGQVVKTSTKTYESHQLHSCFQQMMEQSSMRKNHPAIYPVELPLQYIEAMTDEDDLIVDPFGGSGTTLIAAEKTGRKCRMMEISPKYVDVIIKRWQLFTEKDATLSGSGKCFNEVSNA